MPLPTLVHCTQHLLICDEAHRTTGDTAKRDARPLFDEFLPASHRLFLTATPRLLCGGGELASMDDERLYGRYAYRLTRGEAEERGLVVPPRLVTGCSRRGWCCSPR